MMQKFKKSVKNLLTKNSKTQPLKENYEAHKEAMTELEAHVVSVLLNDRYLAKSHGNDYMYFSMKDSNDLSLAQFIFKQYGIQMEIHMTSLQKDKVLRIKVSDLKLLDKSAENFYKLVRVMDMMEYGNVTREIRGLKIPKSNINPEFVEQTKRKYLNEMMLAAKAHPETSKTK